METESFRERNRQRRAQNAFQHLRAYAEAQKLPDPEAAAKEAAEQLHSAEGAGERAERRRQRARAAAERAARQPGSRVEDISAPPAQPRQPQAPRAAKGSGGKKSSAKAAPAPTARKTKVQPEPGDSVPHRLEDRTKEQLYARAQELEIEGRSQMTKDELIAAIRAKQ